MVNVRANFPNKYKHESLECHHCRQNNTQTDEQTANPLDSQSHLLESCPAYSDLRDQFDTETDLGIVHFFRAVMERRSKEND